MELPSIVKSCIEQSAPFSVVRRAYEEECSSSDISLQLLLVHAVWHSKTNIIKGFLRDPLYIAKCHSFSPNVPSPLWEAIRGNNEELVVLFLQHGFDPTSPVRVPDSIGYVTPFIGVIQLDNDRMLNLILSWTDTTRFRKRECKCVLHVACEHGSSNCLRILLDIPQFSQNINVKNEYDETALLISVKRSLPCANILLDYDANPNIQDYKLHENALHVLCLILSRTNFCEELVDNIDARVTTALKLLRTGIDTNLTRRDGSTALSVLFHTRGYLPNEITTSAEISKKIWLLGKQLCDKSDIENRTIAIRECVQDIYFVLSSFAESGIYSYRTRSVDLSVANLSEVMKRVIYLMESGANPLACNEHGKCTLFYILQHLKTCHVSNLTSDAYVKHRECIGIAHHIFNCCVRVDNCFSKDFELIRSLLQIDLVLYFPLLDSYADMLSPTARNTFLMQIADQVDSPIREKLLTRYGMQYSLKHITRLTVLRCLPSTMREVMQKLPIPDKLKNYLAGI